MPGFYHDPSEDINYLKNLLEDQYPASAVIKELLQNADDAEAENFNIGYYPGMSNSCHPLLKCPAMLAANDGEFLATHKDKIHRIGTGSKVDDAKSIGKFGLGMKSIFHLCEAYFYIASPNQPASNGFPLVDVLNPWSDTKKHPSWEENFNEDAKKQLINATSEWLKEMKHWFCLWIPLRNRSILENEKPLVQRFPQFNDIQTEASEQLISGMMPLLRNVKNVSFSKFNDAWLSEFTISFAENIEQCIGPERPELLKPGSIKDLDTHLKCESSGLKVTVIGTEKLLNGKIYQNFRNQDGWPNRSIITEEYELEIVPEEHVPHTGAFWVHSPVIDGQKGKLQILPAVFLPLQEPFDERNLEISCNIQLLLHGCFFLDSGRKHIKLKREGYGHDSNIDENPVQIEWNKALLNNGVFPNVLPTFERFIKKIQFNHDEIKKITQSICYTSFFSDKENREIICKDRKWVAKLTVDGPCWLLLKKDESILRIPDSDDLNLPFKIFPDLVNICKRENVTFQGWPSLCAEYNQVSWGEKLNELVKGLCRQNISSPEELEYITLLIKQEGYSISEEALKSIISVIQQLITELDDSLKIPIKLLIESFPQPRYIQLQSANINKEFWNSVGALKLNTLILPKSLLNLSNDAKILTLEDARKVLKWVENCKEIPNKSVVANEIINACNSQHDELFQGLGNYKVFDVINRKNSERNTVSWNDINLLLKNNQLFLIDRSMSQCVKAMIDALPEQCIYSIVEGALRDISKTLSGENTIPDCNANTVRHLLSYKPSLSSPENRNALIGFLSNDTPEDDEKRNHHRAIRYLLHNRPERYEEDNISLLAVSQHNKLWEKVEDKILSLSGERWRLVDNNLVRVLLRRDEFNIKVIDKNTVIDEMERHQCENITGSDFKEEERHMLLRELKDKEQLWKKIKIHQAITGDFVNINNETYYKTDLKVPSEIEHDVILLRVPDNNEIADIYKKYVKAWDISALIKIVLSQESPVRFCDDIMTALSNIDDNEINDDVIKLLSQTAWLKSNNNQQQIEPHKVVYIPGMEDIVARLFNNEGIQGSFYNEDMLLPGVVQSLGINYLRKHCFATILNAVELIGESIKSLPDYHIGNNAAFHDITENIKMTRLQTLLQTAGVVLPWHKGLELLKAVNDNISPEAALLLIDYMLINPPINDLLQIITALQINAEQLPVNERVNMVIVHAWFIGILVRHPEYNRSLLLTLYLRNKYGQWKIAKSLCMDVDGVNPSNIIADDLADIIGHNTGFEAATVVQTPQNIQLDDVESANTLSSYFRSWEGRVPDGVIGAFIAYLGDAPEFLSLSHNYLGQRSVEYVRDKCQWIDFSHREFVAEPTIHEAMRHQRFSIQVISSSNSVYVTNICGVPFWAPIDETFDTLFIGDIGFFEVRRFNDRRYLLKIRKINPNQYSKIELSNLLLNTTHTLLKRAFEQRSSSLESLWQQLTESDQLDIAVTQQIVIKHAPFYFQQLRSLSDERLKDISKKIRDIEYREQEYQQGGITSSQNNDLTAINNEQQSLLSGLQQMIENDTDVQSCILNAVRGKVRDFQYSEESILFELFQNADDAVIELQKMKNYNDETEMGLSQKVVIKILDNSVYLLHWGRPINMFRESGFSAEQGRNLGYHRDLEKMLFLSTSDKSDNHVQVTGKFGLGFKSIFLVSEHPLVLSGELGFVVVGGLYPKQLSIEERRELKNITEQYDNKSSTIIAMKDINTDALNKLVTKFQRFIPILLAFSRSIRKCDYHENGSNSFSWTADRVSGTTTIMTGCSSEPSLFNRALLFTRNSSRGILLLKLSARGVVKFDVDVPSIWNTAPTDEAIFAGFALNGDFALDVGRGRLAALEHQKDEIRNIGLSIEKSLIELFKTASDNWDKLREELGIAGDISPYQFWESIWETFNIARWLQDEQDHQNRAVQLIQDIVWGTGNGMNAFTEKYKVIPTSLPGIYETLTSLDLIEYETVGILDHQGLFLEASNWNEVSSKLLPGKIISSQRVGTRIDAMIKTSEKRNKIRIQNIIEMFVGNNNIVTSEIASRLGKWLKGWENITKLSNDGEEEISIFLQSLYFRTADDSCDKATELISLNKTGVDAQEERLRASFAPKNRLLADDYTDDALHFFRLCRGVMSADAKTLASWGEYAVSNDDKKAFLKYLLEGELSKKIRDIIIKIEEPMWWNQHDYIQSLFSNDDKTYKKVLALLEMLPDQSIVENYIDDDNIGEDVDSVSDQSYVISRISEWWHENRDRYIPDFNKLHYPNPSVMLDAITSQYKNTKEQRQYWMMLFMRGALETMGNRRPVQHLGFLKLCYEKNWLSALGAGEPSAEQLSKILDEYFQRPSEYLTYFQWLKEYFPFYFLSNWADDYINAIQITGNTPADELRNCNPDALFNTRSNPDFQGGGPDAPPISNVLGIGRLFVIREIKRLGIAKAKWLDPYCYVPLKRVRRVMARLGCKNLESIQSRDEQSMAIYEFLKENLGEEDCVFQGDYDLPLQIIANNPKLWEEFLQEVIPDWVDDENRGEV